MMSDFYEIIEEYIKDNFNADFMPVQKFLHYAFPKYNPFDSNNNWDEIYKVLADIGALNKEEDVSTLRESIKSPIYKDAELKYGDRTYNVKLIYNEYLIKVRVLCRIYNVPSIIIYYNTDKIIEKMQYVGDGALGSYFNNDTQK